MGSPPAAPSFPTSEVPSSLPAETLLNRIQELEANDSHLQSEMSILIERHHSEQRSQLPSHCLSLSGERRRRSLSDFPGRSRFDPLQTPHVALPRADWMKPSTTRSHSPHRQASFISQKLHRASFPFRFWSPKRERSSVSCNSNPSDRSDEPEQSPVARQTFPEQLVD
eukprot:c12248_g1_i1 orf=2-502(-)